MQRNPKHQTDTKTNHWLTMGLLLCIFACIIGCDQTTPPQHGTTQQAIINGNIDISQPAVVALVDEHNRAFCTGTLIGPQYVLTTAQCGAVLKDNTLANRRIRIDHLDQGENTYHYHYYNVAIVQPHFAYIPGKSNHDLAILILVKSVTEVAPITLNATAMDRSWVGTKLSLVGYGLWQALIQKKESKHKRSAQIPVTEVYSDQFTTYSKTQRICHGDSGGPALIMREGRPYLVGVTAYTTSSKNPNGQTNCDGPGYSMRIDHYLGWINSLLPKPQKKCQSHTDCQPQQACRNSQRMWQPCQPGETCTCVGLGTRTIGQSCDDQLFCADGLACISTGQKRLCLEICNPNANGCLRSGGSCSIKSDIEGLYLCGCNSHKSCHANHACQPLTNDGLTACLPGTKPSPQPPAQPPTQPQPPPTQPPPTQQPPTQQPPTQQPPTQQPPAQQPPAQQANPQTCPKSEQIQTCGIDGTCITQCSTPPQGIGCQSQSSPPTSLYAALFLLGLGTLRRRSSHKN